MKRHEEIAANLAAVESQIQSACDEAARARSEITLVAVTKTFPVEDAQILYDLGLRHFGENRDQEGAAKAPILPDDVVWHFQGQIQSKKIKSIVEWADLIHSVDDLDHALKISQRAPGFEVLVQVDLDPDSSEVRGGVRPDRLPEFLDRIGALDLLISGLMTVAPLGVEPARAFADLAEIFNNHG
jgi:pyridoxal phosphate enzyme (YggS family)